MESVTHLRKRKAFRAIRRYFMFGHVHYSGHEIVDDQKLAAFFPREAIEEQREWIKKKRDTTTSVMDNLRNASYPSSWPEDIVDFRNNLPVITYNCGHATGERLEQILRYYKGYAVIALLGTRRGIRTAPRGRDQWNDEKQSLRREYQAAGFHILDWGFSRASRSPSSNRNCGIIIALNLQLLKHLRIFERFDPPRSYAGRVCGVRFGRRSHLAEKDIDLKVCAGYAPQSSDPEDIRNDYHTHLARILHSAGRTMVLLCTDGNAAIAP